MRRILIVMAAGLGAVLLVVEAAGATPGVDLTRTVLAQSTVDPFQVGSDEIQMNALNRADIVKQQVTVAPGGDTGWHTHWGPAFVLVKSGAFSLTHATGCETHVYQAWQDFDAHIARRTAAKDHTWVSRFRPDQLVALARRAGFNDVRDASSDELIRLYFADRSDGFRPTTAEHLLVATV